MMVENNTKNGVYTEYYEWAPGAVSKADLRLEGGIPEKSFELNTKQKKLEVNYVNGLKEGLQTEWYESGVKSKEVNYTNGKEHGSTIGWHENGNVEFKGHNIAGLAEGLVEAWHENGTKMSQVSYTKDKREGSYIEWHSNGVKFTEMNYKDGLENGDEIAWNKNGVMVYKGYLINDSAEGLATYWHDNGKKSSEGMHKNNVKDGVWLSWDEVGTKIMEADFKNDKMNGFMTAFHNNGNKWYEGKYKDDKANGLFVHWFDSGEKDSEINFKNAKRNGHCTWWNKNGNIVSQENYINGKFKHFSGFTTTDQNLQKSIDSMSYDDKEVVSRLLEHYSEALPSLVIGRASPMQTEDVNTLGSHMAGAASKGDFRGIAISCFCNPGKDFEKYLPVSLNQMDEHARRYFVSLIQAFGGIGFSKSGARYLLNNKHHVATLAESGEHDMQYLMGYWYSFDDVDSIGEEQCIINRRDWYEKAALGGYQPAFYDAGTLFDGDEGDDSRDLGKAAYWYYQGVLTEDIPSCFNLGIMYAMGDFVEKNLDSASFYLSLVYRNAHKIPKFSHFEQQAKDYLEQYGIALQSPPYIYGDKELDPTTAELSNIYPKQNHE
jgi:antitoxin component YwqK of YwqJK toxin-antitoxin module